MKIRTVIRFDFSGLAALSVCLSSAAQNKPDAQNKTVVVPTLREEAAKNGYARKAPIIDYFGCCKDLDDLLQKSELIVRGRPVYENPRLSDDECPSGRTTQSRFSRSISNRGTIWPRAPN